MSKSTQVKELTSKLEQGVKDLFQSDRYADYLKTMSRFHTYSTRNTLLIHMQKPGATHVAGFRAWPTKFKRHVKAGEKAIKILAPTPFVIREEKEKLDPETHLPVLDEGGRPIVEYTERQLARFKAVNVFDVSQTDGAPLPTLVQTLTGDVEQYEAFMDALRAVSPLPIVIEPLPEDTDGRCIFGDKIVLRVGMSEIQTVCAAVHEMAHAKLHDIESLRLMDETTTPKDRRTEEVEAESISYAVCQHFGIETGANSFGYLAEWSRTRELKELNTSLDTIRKTTAELIEVVGDKLQEIVEERGIILAGEEQMKLIEPETVRVARRRTYIHDFELFRQFNRLFPQIASGKYSYLRLEAGGGMMPLSLEWLGDSNRLSVMHTYTMNGDLMYDPMMVFEVDNDFDTMTAVEFEQSNPPLYQRIDEDGIGQSVDGNGNQMTIDGLYNQLNIFASQWFENISQQGYLPIRAVKEVGNEDVQITFDTEGEAILPEPERPKITELDLSLPDPTIDISEMNTYGYSADDMFPLRSGRALELFDTDHTIYLLYPDNTEAMAFDRDEVVVFSSDGLCGITHADWEISPVRAAQLAITANREGSREAELLYGSGDRFGIYQIPDGIDEARNFRFASMRELEALGLVVDRANYKLVYTAPLTASDNLDQIFADFNDDDRPSDFTGRSVSVSDIIVLRQDGDISSHYVDSVGFVELDTFLGEERRSVSAPSIASDTYSQVGNKVTVDSRGDTPKTKPSLMERLEVGKCKATQHGQSGTQKSRENGDATK